MTDDVQVRSVNFFVDDELAATDGTYPFEFRFITPLLSEQSSFSVEARAVDTGGNEQATPSTVIDLVADLSAPAIMAVSPAGIPFSGEDISVIAVYYDEPIDPATLNADSFQLFGAGPDTMLGTQDDDVNYGAISWNEKLSAAFLSFEVPLSEAGYLAVVRAAITDLSGNPLDSDFLWVFGTAGRIRGLFAAGDERWLTVPNGGFETGDTSGWTNHAPHLGVFVASDERAFAENYSARTTVFRDFTGSGFALRQDFQISGGRDYVLSGFFYTAELGQRSSYLDLQDVPFERQAVAVIGIDEWQFVWATFSVPGNVSSVTVRAVRDGFVFIGDIGYVDETAITRVEQFIPPAPLTAGS